MARPSKYTPERAKQICDRLKAGWTRKSAVESVGLDYGTFLNWQERFSSFSTDVTRAEAEAEGICTTRILKEVRAEDGDWRAALEWLKRRRRDEWGDNVTHDIDRQIAELLEKVAEKGQTASSGNLAEDRRG